MAAVLWEELQLLVNMYDANELKLTIPITNYNNNGKQSAAVKSNSDQSINSDHEPINIDLRDILLNNDQLDFETEYRRSIEAVELIANLTIPMQTDQSASSSSNSSQLSIILIVTIDLPREYPSIECFQFFIRSSSAVGGGESILDLVGLRSAAQKYLDEIYVNEPCVSEFLQHLQDRSQEFIVAGGHFQDKTPIKNGKSKGSYPARYWIYSHHIYSSTKRRNLMSLAAECHLNGFMLPGKPGIICIEGQKIDCDGFMEQIKRWNWQKLVTKHEETADFGAKMEEFCKFTEFVELGLSNRCGKHMDMGEFKQYLIEKDLGLVFDILFGF